MLTYIVLSAGYTVLPSRCFENRFPGSILPFFCRYFRPVLTLLSGALIALIFVGFVWAAENKAPVRRIRRNYPGTCLFAVLGAAYFLVSLFEGSATFLIFIALPIACEFQHGNRFGVGGKAKTSQYLDVT